MVSKINAANKVRSLPYLFPAFAMRGEISANMTNGMVVSKPANDGARPTLRFRSDSNGGNMVIGSRRFAPTRKIPNVKIAAESFFRDIKQLPKFIIF